jgi:hypothetical protein
LVRDAAETAGEDFGQARTRIAPAGS